MQQARMPGLVSYRTRAATMRLTCQSMVLLHQRIRAGRWDWLQVSALRLRAAVRLSSACAGGVQWPLAICSVCQAWVHDPVGK